MGPFRLESESDLSPHRRNLFAVIAIFIIILSVYSNTFHASWHLDDEQNIWDRKAMHLTRLDWPQIRQSFLDESGKLYRPVACFSLALNYYFGKLNVLGYHVVNTSIHFLASIFLYLFVYHTLNLPLLKARYGPYSYSLALLTMVFWALNPLHTQAVTYIVQRMASMAGMFYIMSMYFYLKGRTSKPMLLKPANYVMCCVCGILAFGSKQNAAMLPISIFLFDLFLIQGLTKSNIKKNCTILLILMVLVTVLGLILEGPALFQPSHIFSGYEQRPFTLDERLLTEPRIILFYVSLLLYPMPDRLSISHDISISHSLFSPPTTILAIIIISIILIISIIKAKKWPLFAFCIIFFFLNHSIESSFFPLELVFEHRNYLPSMLFFVPLAILIFTGIQLFSARRRMKLIFVAFITLVFIGQGHSTFIRNFIWKTDESLWIDATEKAPHLFRPWHNLGRHYSLQNMHEEALAAFHTALSKESINNIEAKCLTFYDLGVEYHRTGKREEALYYYGKAESLSPYFANICNNKGALYADAGSDNEARVEFEKAIHYDKGHTNARRNLGLVLLRKGLIEEGTRELETALEIDPEDPLTLKFLAYAYRLKGSYGRAFLMLNRALRTLNRQPEVLLYLSELLYRNGRTERAEKLVRQFIASEKQGSLQAYMDGLAEKEERLDRIRDIRKPVLMCLSGEYEERISIVSRDRGRAENNGR